MSIQDKTVTMAHGAGGRQTSELIDRRKEEWLYLQMDLLYLLHFFQEEILANFLFAEQSTIWHVWEQNLCTLPVLL